MQTNFADRLDDVTVADIMDREPVTIRRPTCAPSRRYDDFFLRYQGWSWFPVVDADRRFVGLIHQAGGRARVHLGGAQADRTVRELMDPDDGEGSVGADAPLEALLAPSRCAASAR